MANENAIAIGFRNTCQKPLKLPPHPKSGRHSDSANRRIEPGKTVFVDLEHAERISANMTVQSWIRLGMLEVVNPPTEDSRASQESS